MPLPQPDDLTSLVVRTDLDDEGAGDAVRAAFGAADASGRLRGFGGV
ncbi:hypothetical protein [Streptomyces sp. WAC07061]|nr:hypothetical protein [Streptomyces sp. WAC07061]